jgi:hypothetical protein
MRGHRSGRKTEWFSRLRFGASGRASRQRSPAFDGYAQFSRTGTLARFLIALKSLLLATMPVVQLSRSASESKAGPPDPADASADYSHRERVQLENLEADTRLKELQAQALEDEHELLPLKRREHKLNIENAEIKRGLSLAGVVFVGAVLVAGVVLGIADPSLNQSSPSLFELCKLLLGK